MINVIISLDGHALDQLIKLRGAPAVGPNATVEEIAAYILRGFADGVRRPGSWERQAVRMFFGDTINLDAAPMRFKP